MSLRQFDYSIYTTNIPWKSFVKESQNPVENTLKKEVHYVNFEGNDAKAAYEEVLSQECGTCPKPDLPQSRPNTSKSRSVVKAPPNNIQSKKNQSSKETAPTTSINAILKAVERKDLKFLFEHVTSENVNLTDEFGWTPLMSAAYCGHMEIVELLLSLGANKKARDRSGYTAAQLALKRNYLNIVALLKRKTEYADAKALSDSIADISKIKIEVSSSTKSETAEPLKECNGTMNSNEKEESHRNSGFYCEVCDATFYHATPKKHEASTLHIFNTKPKLPGAMYGISKQNKGYQMLINTGWDEQGGLGPSGKGIKYPVKTYFKTDRKGLGQPLVKEPRVTHFKAGDTQAINNFKQAKQKGLKKRDREKLLNLEARKERALRIALS